MKKFLSALLAALVAFGLTACGGANKGEVSLKYYSAASDMLPALKTEQLSVGLLPEPAATKLTKMNDKFSVAFDVQTLYGGDYPQAVLVVKKSVAESDSAFVKSLMAAVTENQTWVKENAASAVAAVNGALAAGVTASLDNSVTGKVVENCNIYFEAASDAKTDVNAYLAAVKEIEADAAKTLADGFFYSAPATDTENAGGSYSVFMPDGAPALAMAKLIADENMLGRTVSYSVISSSDIGPTVVQNKADVAILPVTAASKTIGTGENYVMLGVVTHGNLFIMSNKHFDGIKDLSGETIGVIQQGQVPDLTLKAVLKKNGVSYKTAE